MLRTTYYVSPRKGKREKTAKPKNRAIQWHLMLLLVLYVAGVSFGACYVKEGAQAYPLFRLITQSLEDKGGEGFVATFLHSLFSVMIYAASAYILGFCALGAPFIVLLPAMRGLGLGISIGYLYAAYGWQGFIFSLVMIIPYAVVTSLAIIFACRQSLRLSLLFFINIFNNEGKIKTVSSQVTVRYIYIIAVIFAATFVDSVVAVLFSGVITAV